MFKKWLALMLLLGVVVLARGESYQDRWFYVARSLNGEKDLENVEELVRTAGKAGLNGMLFACGVESYGTWSGVRKERLAKLRKTCAESGVEIIPIIWSVGYGTMLGRDLNYVEGVPCRNIPYVAKGNKAVLKMEKSLVIENGDFEQHQGDNFAVDGWIDQPGKKSFADTEVKHGGECSLRLQAFEPEKDPHGHWRVCLNVKLKPHRQYCMKAFVKTEGLMPNKGKFLMQFYRMNGEQVISTAPDVKETQDWTECRLSFSSGDETEGRLYLGMWGGKAGKVWIDDVSLENDGVWNVVRREGTPFVVKNADTGRVYEEGRDYARIEGLKRLTYGGDNEQSLELDLPNGSAIHDGDQLLIDYYHPVRVGVSQYTVCMSVPALYDEFKRSAKEIVEALQPKKWFLSMDEIRSGGTCLNCEARHTDMAHILADCIKQQRQIIRDVCPEAEIYIWSDMLDPYHNAHDNYYNCKGTYAGVWNLIPKDLIISCWYYDKRNQSMPFFEKLGFRTQAAAYYDVDSLDSSRDWLELCNHTKNCTGIMYTSWRNKYALLADFGKMVQEGSNPKK